MVSCRVSHNKSSKFKIQKFQRISDIIGKDLNFSEFHNIHMTHSMDRNKCQDNKLSSVDIVWMLGWYLVDLTQLQQTIE